MAEYLWRGGTALTAAADWTDLSTGASPAATPPQQGDSATIGPVGLLDATGTEQIGSLMLQADLALGGFLQTTTLALGGGTIEAMPQGTLVIGAALAQPAEIAVGTGGTLAGYGRIDAAVTLTGGTLAATGGALALFGAISGTGTLAVTPGATLFPAGAVAASATIFFEGAGGTLDIFAPGSFAATIAGFSLGDVIDLADIAPAAATLDLPGIPAPSALLALPDGYGGTALVLAPPAQSLPSSTGTLTLGSPTTVSVYAGPSSVGSVSATGTVALTGSLHTIALTAPSLLAVIGGGRLTAGSIAVGGTLAALSGGGVAAATLTLADGTLSADIASNIAIGGNGASGTVAIASGGLLVGNGRINTPLTDDGTVEVQGGVLSIFAPVQGTGTLAIAPNTILFAAAALNGPTIDFGGGGATLEANGSLSVSLAGLSIGDAIDLSAAPGVAAAIVDALPVLGAPPSRVFAPAADGRGGTLLTVIACFAAGTRIATPEGEVAVEHLRPGDPVMTQDGPRPLTWTAHSRIAAPDMRPVRLRAGALGQGVPRRDLLLSPEHAVLVGGLLVPAAGLLAQPGIVRAPAGVTEYHHLGLAQHALLLAEGAWAESYLPDLESSVFAAECGLRPHPAQPCRPRIAGLPQRPGGGGGTLRGHVERIIDDGTTLRIEGWALDAAPPVGLELRRGGMPIARFVADRWRADLDRAGLGDGRCGFLLHAANPSARLSLHRIGDGARLPGPA